MNFDFSRRDSRIPSEPVNQVHYSSCSECNCYLSLVPVATEILSTTCKCTECSKALCMHQAKHVESNTVVSAHSNAADIVVDGQEMRSRYKLTDSALPIMRKSNFLFCFFLFN